MDDSQFEELMPGVLFRVDAPGSGMPPEYAQVVHCSYTGRIQSTGEVFEEVQHRRIRVGDGDVPPALELALKRMHPNERACVRAESRFAYGPKGRPAKKGEVDRAVPPDADLEWSVETHNLGTAKAAGEMTPAEQFEEAENRKALGNEHFAHAEWSKAAKSYEEAMKSINFESYPSHSEERAKAVQVVLDSGNNLTLALMKMEEWAKAKQACIHVLQVDGRNLKALFRASQIAMTQHLHEEATAALNRAQELYPNSEEVRVQQRLLEKTKVAYKRKERKMARALGGFILNAPKENETGKNPCQEQHAQLPSTGRAPAEGGSVESLRVMSHTTQPNTRHKMPAWMTWALFVAALAVFAAAVSRRDALAALFSSRYGRTPR